MGCYADYGGAGCYWLDGGCVGREFGDDCGDGGDGEGRCDGLRGSDGAGSGEGERFDGVGIDGPGDRGAGCCGFQRREGGFFDFDTLSGECSCKGCRLRMERDCTGVGEVPIYPFKGSQERFACCCEVRWLAVYIIWGLSEDLSDFRCGECRSPITSQSDNHSE